MKHPIIRFAAAALGVLGALVIAVVLVAGLPDAGRIPESASWAIPLIAGAAVGLLSLFLLAGTSEDEEAAKRVSVRCASCGMDVLEDWRLCPHCGGSNECESTSVRVPTGIGG